MSFDLLTTVEYGGCSAKLPPGALREVLAALPASKDPNLLVDIDTADDAGVYRISDTVALIQTVDFFPPVCSDPGDFGRIAAANALSDVYAMGGAALTAMNIVMFPQSRIPLEVLGEILRGGQEKVAEAGAVIVGGHTIDDYPPKYGLSVTGTVHPGRIVTNAAARPGDVIVLTKALGTGIIAAGRRMEMTAEAHYRASIDSMKLLNKTGARIMQKFGVRAATDITGFGLLGHCHQMAEASGVTLRIGASSLPLLDGAYDLADAGCLPGAMFRNLDYVEPHSSFAPHLDYNLRMLMVDAQTSGGLCMCLGPGHVNEAVRELRAGGYPRTSVIGVVTERSGPSLAIER